MASKKARLSETERFIELWHEECFWNILSDNYKIRQEKEKSVAWILEKLEMTSNHFIKMFTVFRKTSNKRSPLKRAPLLGIHIEISASL